MNILEYISRVSVCNKDLGRFYECQKYNNISYNVGTHALPDMYALGSRASCIHFRTYQAKHSCPCYNYYMYNYISNYVCSKDITKTQQLATCFLNKANLPIPASY